MALNWNEIKARAADFASEWQSKAAFAREEADAQTFENAFFSIFGVSRSQMAIFEKKVKLRDGSNGYIDLFWKGHILIEMKTPGKDMQKAYEQAKTYANALPAADLPKGILICDFVNFHYYNLLEDGKLYAFTLAKLVDNIMLFSDLAGYVEEEYRQQDAVNIEAAERMGKLHDRFKAIGYEGHPLEVYLVRLLFCLFAEDTGIFEKNLLTNYIKQRTNPDGSDLALHLEKIFEVLDKISYERLTTLDEQLNKFPYINGRLFATRLDTLDFDSAMRNTLLECCALDWSKISPAIFGAMFQSVMNAEKRHNLGAHYTSEENILKVIKPLFLDDLWEEFEDICNNFKAKLRKAKLQEFQTKIASLKFLDPACGCGNFLVISYRELRMLEFAVLKELFADSNGQRVLNVSDYIKVSVKQFYGIEIEEFPSHIAQTALWLTDHQMNLIVGQHFGQYFAHIPLPNSLTIVGGNALQIKWETVVPKTELSYILGNPPFLGARVMNAQQKSEVERIFGGTKKSGELDYVSCWYRKAAEYIQDTNIEVAFVSTNSICQGEQLLILWSELMNKFRVKINFAHQTFKWTNEARGKAAVYCVIVGFGLREREKKWLYVYKDVRGEAKKVHAKQINPYLIDTKNVFLESRSKPLCNVPPMNFGNVALDHGHLIFSEQEKKDFISKEPASKKWFKKLLGAEDLLHSRTRWCLWLVGINTLELRAMPYVMERVKLVKAARLAAKDKGAQKLADKAHLFRDLNNPSHYVAIPITTSENRDYVPLVYANKSSIPAVTVQALPNATLYHFGILSSTMHMAWMRYVCGRLKSDYRYSKDIVYNNFPWPNASDKQKASIEELAQAVLDARAAHPTSTLADLYHPLIMPLDLLKAHQKLDRAVERAYGRSFDYYDDMSRVAFLFEQYQRLTAGLFA
ncbi:methylase [Bacteroidia bacterium]|nr:methylase [Bacteroidia bacterium]